MSMEIKGGIIRPVVLTVATTGSQFSFLATTKFLQISNEGANDLRVYFTQADFDEDSGGTGTHFIQLPASSGFFEGPVETLSVWMRGVGGNATLTLVPYYRKG